MFIAALLLSTMQGLAQEGSIPPVQAEDAASSERQPAPGEITRDEAAARLADCGVRRFESSATGLIDGKMRRTSIRLCASDRETSAEWLAKLEKSAQQVESQPRLPAEVKTKLLADLNAEIAKVKDQRPASAAAGAVTAMPNINASILATPEARKAEREPAITGLPPLPPAPKTAPQSTIYSGAATAAASAATPAFVRKPTVTVRCLSVGASGSGGSCGRMGKDTLLAITADEDIRTPVSLRFSRGRRDAEVLLAGSGLKRGEVVRARVPAEICRGVVRAEFDLELVLAAPGGFGAPSQPVGTFDTRC